jgi:hypothetical protein
MENFDKTQNVTLKPDVTTSIDGHSTSHPHRTYQAWGVHQAGLVDGDPNVLFANLEATHIKARRTIAENDQLQNNRKTELQNQIDILEADEEDCKKKIQDEQEKLDHEESKIKTLIEEINDWKLRPQEMLKGLGKDAYDKLTFGIGGIILILLTVYLFVFYSSAAYSAFFKNFTADDANIVNAIFDAQALLKAYSESITTLIFILFITGVFLGLGFLINVYEKQKGFGKFFKLLAIIVVTFIFDFIIAYEIVHKIYDIKVAGSFQILPVMTIGMAFQEINFWLIIFAGFVVYIIWGLVYNAFAKEYEKFDAVKYNIKIREGKIEEYKDECKVIKKKMQELETQKNSISAKIKNRKNELSGVIVLVSDIKEYIGDFFTGWVSVLKNSGKEEHIEQCKQIKEDFISNLFNNAFYTNVSN